MYKLVETPGNLASCKGKADFFWNLDSLVKYLEQQVPDSCWEDSYFPDPLEYVEMIDLDKLEALLVYLNEKYPLNFEVSSVFNREVRKL